MILTKKILKQLINYNPNTGIVTWKYRNRKWFSCDFSYKAWNIKNANKICNSKTKDGYGRISVLNKIYKLHRIIFLYMTGKFPEFQIDHIDHDKGNNKWNNLREVSNSVNQKNTKISKRNTSGSVGVSFNKREKSIKLIYKIIIKIKSI